MTSNYRTVSGNVVYVKASQVSHSLKGVIGSRFMEVYVKAVVLESEIRGGVSGKRRATWVKVRIVVGSLSFDVWRPIGQLKEDPPTSLWEPHAPKTSAAAPAATVEAAAGGGEVVAGSRTSAAEESSSSATNNTSSGTSNTSSSGTKDITPQPQSPSDCQEAPVAARADPAQPILLSPPLLPDVESDTTTPNSKLSGSSSLVSRLSGSTSFWHRTPTTESGDRKWFGEGEGAELEVSVNGPRTFRSKSWTLCDQRTEFRYSPGCDKGQISELDYFLAVFPITQLENMVKLTNIQLADKNRDPIDEQGLLKYLGVSLLATRFEFGDRGSLWNEKKRYKYIHPPQFGGTGISKNRYEEITGALRYSNQPSTRPDGMSHETWRWKLVDDFVYNFNEHREQYYTPSFILCVDESMSRWYGLGGHWINMGLPMYVAMDRKPENGAEIQNCCDGNSGIMMKLRLVRTERERAAMGGSVGLYYD